MTQITLDNQTGGFALVVGYCLLIVVLFRNPADGVATATATPQQFLFSVVLPALGIASGVYTAADGPLGTVAAFVGGSYLGVVGIALALLPTTIPLVTTALGIILLVIAALALVASLRSSIESLFP